VVVILYFGYFVILAGKPAAIPVHYVFATPQLHIPQLTR